MRERKREILCHHQRGKAGALVRRDQGEDMAWGPRRHPGAHQLLGWMRPQILETLHRVLGHQC